MFGEKRNAKKQDTRERDFIVKVGLPRTEILRYAQDDN
jgi:hypothetical protein